MKRVISQKIARLINQNHDDAGVPSMLVTYPKLHVCDVFCVTPSCSSPRIQAEEEEEKKEKKGEIPKNKLTFLAGAVRVGNSPARHLPEGGIP